MDGRERDTQLVLARVGNPSPQTSYSFCIAFVKISGFARRWSYPMDIKRPAKEDTGKFSLLALLM
jgi:hypothetical protein